MNKFIIPVILIISLINTSLSCVDSGRDNIVATPPSEGEGTDEVTTVVDDDSADSEADSGDESSSSLMHGGSPAPVTWTDCNQWPGSHPCDFSLEDQYGDIFTLYDNYDTVMVLDFSTMWCSVCKNIAWDVQSYQDTYGSQGFLWVTVLIEDPQGSAPDSEDLNNWASTYGIVDSPVLAGNRQDFVDLTGMDGYPISAWPTFVVISREMVLYNGVNGWSEEVVLGWVEDNL